MQAKASVIRLAAEELDFETPAVIAEFEIICNFHEGTEFWWYHSLTRETAINEEALYKPQGEDPWRVLKFYSCIDRMRYSLKKRGVNAKLVEAFNINPQSYLYLFSLLLSHFYARMACMATLLFLYPPYPPNS